VFEPLSQIRRTLRSHYRHKREHYVVSGRNSTIATCAGLFTDAPEAARNPTRRGSSAGFAGTCGGAWPPGTGIYQYTIDQVLEDIIGRCSS